MKRRIYALNVACLIILCFLCSCSTGKSNTASNIPPINCEYGYSNFAVSGEEDYYFLCHGLISCWDGNMNHKAVPLCKRPDCKHNSNECQSYVMGAQLKIFYVDGNLYLFSLLSSKDPVTKAEVFPLWKVAADGTFKEKVLFVNELPANYTIFEDKVYYEFRTKNARGKTISRILCQPLEGGEEKLIWESSLQNGALSTLQGIGDKLYFYEEGIDISIDMAAPDFDMNEIKTEYNMYTYQPKTGELIKNPKVNGKDGDKVIIRNIYDGKLFYSYWDDSKNEMWYRVIDCEEEEHCLGSKPPYVNIADSEYAYTYCRREAEIGSNGMKVYDHEGNLLQDIQLPHMDDNMMWIPATEDYIFGYYTGPVKEDGQLETAIILLERDKIAEGKAELIRIFENE